MRFKVGFPPSIVANKAALEQMQVNSLLWGTAFAGMLSMLFEWISPGLFVNIFTYDASVQSIFPFPTVVAVVCIVLVSAPFHEGAHALLADKQQLVVGFAPKALMFYVAPYGTYSKKRAVLLALLPCLLFTVVPFGVALLSDNLSVVAWALVVAVSHALGCGGDLWVCSRILKIRSARVQYGDFSSGGGWSAVA